MHLANLFINYTLISHSSTEVKEFKKKKKKKIEADSVIVSTAECYDKWKAHIKKINTNHDNNNNSKCQRKKERKRTIRTTCT